eukprot:SAG22_NODE_5502_length_1003_cov_1.110619_1_plen_45_part_10
MKGPDGKPLVALPPRRVEIVRLEHSPEEADFYRCVRCCPGLHVQD